MKIAQGAPIELYNSSQGNLKGFGPLGLENSPTGYASTFQNFISSLIGIMGVIAIIWFVVIIITGGIAYMSAGSDTKATEGARKKITSGLTGLLITLFGIFILVIVAQILGIDNLLNIVYWLNILAIQ